MALGVLSQSNRRRDLRAGLSVLIAEFRSEVAAGRLTDAVPKDRLCLCAAQHRHLVSVIMATNFEATLYAWNSG